VVKCSEFSDEALCNSETTCKWNDNNGVCQTSDSDDLCVLSNCPDGQSCNPRRENVGMIVRGLEIPPTA